MRVVARGRPRQGSHCRCVIRGRQESASWGAESTGIGGLGETCSTSGAAPRAVTKSAAEDLPTHPEKDTWSATAPLCSIGLQQCARGWVSAEHSGIFIQVRVL